MTTTDARQKLDDAIAETKRKLKRLQALRAMIDDDDVAAELTELFAVSDNGAPKPEAPRHVSKNMERIRKFFHSHNNNWATAKEIEAGAKVTLNSLRQLLYRSYVHEFDRDGQVGYGKRSRFRLKETKPA